jgi:predicted permease
MPAAVMNVVLAGRYDADRGQVATTVLISTLLAVVTVPAVIVWIG